MPRQAREVENHVDGRRLEADQAAHLGDGAGQHVDLERSAVREVLQHRHRCSRAASVMAMRFSIGCGRTTPSALATASASVIMPLTIATISGRSAIAPSVAPVSTATGFQYHLGPDLTANVAAHGRAHIGLHHGLRQRHHTVRARAVCFADGERRALAVLANDAWLGHLRADPVDAADGALGPEDLPLPPARIERDPAPVS
jgi:hypothetical protein